MSNNSIGAYAQGGLNEIGAYEYAAALTGEIVTMILTDRAGIRRGDLTGIKWSWFDETTPDTFNAPTDQGSAEITDTDGIITITLSGTSLVTGQRGCLALTTTDDVNTGIYKLRIK